MPQRPPPDAHRHPPLRQRQPRRPSAPQLGPARHAPPAGSTTSPSAPPRGSPSPPRIGPRAPSIRTLDSTRSIAAPRTRGHTKAQPTHQFHHERRGRRLSRPDPLVPHRPVPQRRRNLVGRQRAGPGSPSTTARRTPARSSPATTATASPSAAPTASASTSAASSRRPGEQAPGSPLVQPRYDHGGLRSERHTRLPEVIRTDVRLKDAVNCIRKKKSEEMLNAVGRQSSRRTFDEPFIRASLCVRLSLKREPVCVGIKQAHSGGTSSSTADPRTCTGTWPRSNTACSNHLDFAETRNAGSSRYEVSPAAYGNRYGTRIIQDSWGIGTGA